MSRTTRKNYRGEPLRDGEHGHKCPSANCNICGTGFYRRIFSKLRRKQGKREANERS